MALYAIGDLHLSLTADKPMEVFGPAWENYTERIGDALSRLTAGDVLVLAGDTSWGIDLNEAEADFRFLDQFPCKKYLVKGNLVVHGVQNEELLHGEGPYHPGLSP